MNQSKPCDYILNFQTQNKLVDYEFLILEQNIEQEFAFPANH